jgi:hypothetical protein
MHGFPGESVGGCLYRPAKLTLPLGSHACGVSPQVKQLPSSAYHWGKGNFMRGLMLKAKGIRNNIFFPFPFPPPECPIPNTHARTNNHPII